MEILKVNEPFSLQLGGSLDGLEIAYHTYGTLSPERDNVVWVCHALTANSDVADWWPHTVVPGGFLDPDKYFIVCANILGSCYGTTGPLSVNPATGLPYYGSFPKLTVGDWARAHSLLADHLGIRKIRELVGSSVGGFQALEWAAQESERFDSMILIATDAIATPWSIAIDETQRMAILADNTYGEPREDAGATGLAAARAIGLLTYRGGEGYNRTQRNHPDTPAGTHRACSYQRYQGEKLVRRYNAYSYMTILDAFDTHDIGRNRGGLPKVLGSLKMPALVVGITTDMIFPPEDMKGLARQLGNAEYREIDSPFGHDGFLVEHEQLRSIIEQFRTSWTK